MTGLPRPARSFVAALARRREAAPLVALLLAGGLVLGFVEIADELGEDEVHAVDEAILLALREPGDPADPLGPEWVEEVGRDLTALGSMGVLALVTLAVGGYLLIDRKRRAALFVLLAVGGGTALSLLLKQGFDRPRPDLVPHEAEVFTASFPSSHAMLSAVAYLTLGALLTRVAGGRPLRAYVLLLAMATTFLVGISRVYLGVHWPTDVLAGWVGGAAWALVCWLAAMVLQRRGKVEDEGKPRAAQPPM